MINFAGFGIFDNSDNLFNEFALIPEAFVSPSMEPPVAFFGVFFSFSLILVIAKTEILLTFQCEFYFS